MSKLPYTAALRQSYQAQFGGLNHRKGASDGDIFDMRNMTSDHYPVLSPREKRRILGNVDVIYGMYCYGEHVFLAAKKGEECGLYLNGEKLLDLDESEKQMEAIAKKIVIFPDKVFFDLNALDALGSFDSAEELETVENPQNGDIYIAEHDIYFWQVYEWVKSGPVSGSMESSVTGRAEFGSGELNGNAVKFNEIRLYDQDLSGFREGDAVTIRGCSVVPQNNKTAIIREIHGDRLEFSEYAFSGEADYYYFEVTEKLSANTTGMLPMIPTYGFYHGKEPVMFQLTEDAEKGGTFVWYVGDSHVTYNKPAEGSYGQAFELDLLDPALNGITRELDFVAEYKAQYVEEAVTVSRDIPEFEFILAVNNRLWGAKGDTVFGSALGDPLNFNKFDGLSTDSYSVQLGSAGDVTGIANYNGYPTFFKEDGIYKLYGAYPSAFQMYATATNGVKTECGKSIAKIGDALFYVSKNGVMMYAGGVPTYIGNELGVRIATAVGGTDGRKYYLSAETDEGRKLYVYDTFLNLWHIEDELEVVAMSYGDALLCGTTEGDLLALSRGANGAEEKDLDWMVRFADAVVGSPNKKGVQEAIVRADCSGGGWCEVFVLFDGTEEVHMGRIEKDGKYSTMLPIILRRGDHFAIILRGHGIVDLYGLSYKYYHGSEM